MQRLRCIITADCQLLFNQMYVKRDTPLLSFLHAHKKEVEPSLKVDLSYAAQWLTETKLSLQINGIQKPGLQSASSLDASCRLGHCLHYCAAEVWCTGPAMLMSGRSPWGVPSAQRSLSMALADNTFTWICCACNALDTNSTTHGVKVSRQLYWHSWDNLKWEVWNSKEITQIFVHFHSVLNYIRWISVMLLMMTCFVLLQSSPIRRAREAYRLFY